MLKNILGNFLGNKVDQFTVKTYLIDTSWILLNESKNKIIYAFKNSGEFYLSKNGDADQGTWDFISDSESIILKIDNKMSLFNMRLIKDYFLFLQKDNTPEFFILANWTKYQKHEREGILSDYKKIVEGLMINENIFLSSNAESTKYAFALFELKNSIELKENKNRIRSIIDSLVFDQNSGKELLKLFKQKFRKSLIDLINDKYLNREDIIFMCNKLVKFKVVEVY